MTEIVGAKYKSELSTGYPWIGRRVEMKTAAFATGKTLQSSVGLAICQTDHESVNRWYFSPGSRPGHTAPISPILYAPNSAGTDGEASWVDGAAGIIVLMGQTRSGPAPGTGNIVTPVSRKGIRVNAAKRKDPSL
jgi:hypothetical protein